jgi:hypothetical protein
MANKNITPIARKSNIVVQILEKEVLIYDLNENSAFSLNETSALIWQMCDGIRTVPQIAESLSAKLNSPITDDFVWIALEQMKKGNLLENSEDISADFGGLSRRDVIRKIGFATLAALPVVSSLIAPASISAASNCTPPIGRTPATLCSESCQCNTGCCRNPPAPAVTPTAGEQSRCGVQNPGPQTPVRPCI